MKIRILLGFCIFLIVAHVFSRIENDQRQEWKGKVVIESGIKIVKNPQIPLYGTLNLDLQEDLNIGKEGNRYYSFWLIQGIQVDDDGNIYVDDVRNFRIQKYDRNGKFNRTIGRRGQGPGEFQQPTKIRMNPQSGRLYVRDTPARRITIFNLQGKNPETVPTNFVISDYYPLADGKFIVCLNNFSEADLRSWYSIGKMDSKGEIASTFGDFPDNTYVERFGGSIVGGSSGYELTLFLAQIDSESFVYGYSKDYKLTIIDKNLKPILQIQKDEAKPVFTKAEKAGFKNIPLPKFKPYFYMLLSDSNGRLYIQNNFTHNKNTSQDDIPKEVDVFSKDGIYIYKTTLPPNTCLIRDGYIYSFLVDQEEGIESVKRYKIKNWVQIKNGP